MRKFALLVGIGFSLILGMIVYTPLSSPMLSMYVSGDRLLINSMRSVLSILFVLPIIMAIQHYFMGLLMLKNATQAIGKAALTANLYLVSGVALFSWINLPLYMVAVQVLLAMMLEIALLRSAIKARKLELI